MNYKKSSYLIFTLFILNTFQITAQTKTFLSYDKSITFSLTTPLDVHNPRWRIGYLQDLNERWKFSIDIGYTNRKFSLGIHNDLIGNKYQIWEIRPEIYYLMNPKKKTKKYFSAELFYINNKDTFSNGHYGAIKYDQVDYRREKYGLNIKYGFIIFSKKRLGFNTYAGLGVRYRNNTFSNVINPITYDERDTVGFLNNNVNTQDHPTYAVNFSLGVKLYYKLYAKKSKGKLK